MRRALVATIALAIVSAGSYGCHPTDHHVIAGFERHRADYEQLLALALQDRHLNRVDRRWYRSQAGDDYKSPQPGLLSARRWRQYRQLFDALRLDAGVLIFGD